MFLTLVKSLVWSDFHVATQNCWVRNGGTFTREVCAEMQDTPVVVALLPDFRENGCITEFDLHLLLEEPYYLM